MSKRKLKNPQPWQPAIAKDGVTRFRANAIVCALLDDAKTLDMNRIFVMPFTDEDRVQFAQLIGYSVRGFGDLRYVSDDAYYAAVNAAERLQLEHTK